jgi:23S rRNA-/tRNA-specific pseudouridylate synthase
VKKQYVALLAGRYQPSSTIITSSAAAATADNNNASVHYDSSSGITTIHLAIAGKPASTSLQVLSHTPSLKFGWITTAQLFPASGRKHQLRLHMSALGHPILRDPLYNQFAGNGLKLAGKGMCLWAQRLEFDHPLTGQLLRVGTEEPARFEKVRQQEAQRHAKFAALP